MSSIELRVRYHPSGNYTLTQQIDNKIMEDCKSELFVNPDKGSFYKAVAQKISDLTGEGHKVSYFDTDEK